MSTQDVNEVGKPSGEAFTANTTQEQTPQEGSLRSLLRTSSDFSKVTMKICNYKDRYPKYRRYAHLKLSEIFTRLTTLYANAFECQWTHFKRAGDAVTGTQGSAADASKAMANIYVSHWVLDLYNTNRNCALKLSTVALNEAYPEEVTPTSQEYDAFLAALNEAMRPTHITGCYEDVMFVPKFPDETDFTKKTDPFNITGFNLNRNKFKLILNAIKDKRIGWRVSNLSTHPTGRPSWLFDWTDGGYICAFFPMTGNFTSQDITIAYILGVACTPKLAHSDDDMLQLLPPVQNVDDINSVTLPTVGTRAVFANYEVDDHKVFKEKFTLYLSDSNHPDAVKATRKRPRARTEDDATTPGHTTRKPLYDDDAMVEEIDLPYVTKRVYLNYSRNVFVDDEDEKMNQFLAFIDPQQHCTL